MKPPCARREDIWAGRRNKISWPCRKRNRISVSRSLWHSHYPGSSLTKKLVSLLKNQMFCAVTKLYTSYFINELIKQIDPHVRVFPDTFINPRLVKKYTSFNGTRMFITAITRARYLLLFWARSIHSTPPSQSLNIHFNIILPSTLPVTHI